MTTTGIMWIDVPHVASCWAPTKWWFRECVTATGEVDGAHHRLGGEYRSWTGSNGEVRSLLAHRRPEPVGIPGAVRAVSDPFGRASQEARRARGSTRIVGWGRHFGSGRRNSASAGSGRCRARICLMDRSTAASTSARRAGERRDMASRSSRARTTHTHAAFARWRLHGPHAGTRLASTSFVTSPSR